MTLEQEFEREALSGCSELKQKYGYNPTYYIRMIHEYGGVGAARALIRTREIQEGLIRLWEHQRLDMSIEARVVAPKCRLLFTEDEIRMARDRLEQLGYQG